MYEFLTTTGWGLSIVKVTFYVASDGDIEDMEVYLGDADVTGVLSEDQLDTIEQECRDQAVKQAAERNGEAAISRYEASL